MERLAVRTETGAALKMNDVYESEAAARKDLMQRYLVAVEYLAAYEDTGLKPEEVKEMEADWVVVKTLLAEYQALGSIDHIQELVQAEKDGRLVILPPPAKYGEPQPECFYNDGSGIWCLGYCKDGDDEPIDVCKQCWYCENGNCADDCAEDGGGK